MDDFKKEYIEARRQVIAKDFPSLNDRQREAVLTIDGPLLILAGAGSGKTTVLINRIADLMKYGRGAESEELPPDADEEKLDIMKRYLAGDLSLKRPAQEAAVLDPVPPWQILAITFTNKAAGEMKDRLDAMLGSAAEDIWARTFHSACVRILRRDADKLGFTNGFTIYDTADRTAVMKRIMKEQDISEKLFTPKWALSVIDRAKDHLQTPQQLAATAAKNGDYKVQKVAGLYEIYQKRLFDDGAMDFEDLIYNTVQLLQTFPDVLSYYQHKFRYILIDEYQDTNHLQYVLASLLAADHHNICVVGDDDQSIYAFRGATIENILQFEDQYPGAKVIRLEQNYRSTGHILDAANSVVSNNRGRKGKKLWTKAGDGDRVTLYIAQNEEDEARYIVQQVLQDVEQGGHLKDHAVLYRMNSQSRALEQAFLRNGIRPRIVKGNPFFERAEIKDIMAYFFVLLNPADELRLLRIINVPARGIGTTTQERAIAIAQANGIPLFAVLSMADQFPELERAAPKLMKFADMMQELFELSSTAGLSELYDALMEKTGYAKQLIVSGKEEDKNRLDNIQELKSFITTHVAASGDDTLAGFLDEVSLYTDLQDMDMDEDTVTLMTVHSAKGLEFPVVFLAGMEEGVFPSSMATSSREQIEEERRLAYVAITRAKDRLIITSARQRMVFGVSATHRVSRFVDEIPAAHIDRPWSPLKADQHSDWFDFEDLPQKQPAKPKPKAQAKRTLTPPSKSKGTGVTGYKVGDRVTHNAFKDGTIISLTPMGGDALMEIDFDEIGKKRLMLKATLPFLKKIP